MCGPEQKTSTPSPQVIYLDPEDDLVSIRDRLSWAREKRVLLVLPDGKADLLHDWLDLKILRRHVDDLRLVVGIAAIFGVLLSGGNADIPAVA